MSGTVLGGGGGEGGDSTRQLQVPKDRVEAMEAERRRLMLYRDAPRHIHGGAQRNRHQYLALAVLLVEVGPVDQPVAFLSDDESYISILDTKHAGVLLANMVRDLRSNPPFDFRAGFES